MLVGDIWKVLLIIIILSILGINVFIYIYRGAKVISSSAITGIDQSISNVGDTSKQILKKTATTSKSILSELEKDLIPSIEYKKPSFIENNSDSRIISNHPITGKHGFCYIGNDKNNRICTEIYPSDICMSGDVFPSMDICINPKLRA